MLLEEFVQLTKARRVGRGRWMAICPAHPDRKPSLAITEGKKGDRIVIICRSMGCDARSIVAALGLKMKDLFYTSRDLPSAELKFIRRQQRIDRMYEAEKRKQELEWFLSIVRQPAKRCVRELGPMEGYDFNLKRVNPPRVPDVFQLLVEIVCDKALIEAGKA